METNVNPIWRLGRGLALDCSANRIAGIVNVTPDSFSDGGRHADTASAVAHGLRLAAAGADMLDVGGESTRPGAASVSLGEEIRRVAPVVSGLLRALPDALVSVDTFKAGCAAAAIEAGAVVINDISACAFDAELTDVLIDRKPGYVLMHCQGRPRSMQEAPRYGDVVEDILAFFEAHLARLARAGLPEEHIVLDPGIGFGKRLEHNLAILRRLDRFLVFGRPLYMGLSNKAFLGAVLGLPVGQRGQATAVASALCAARGARIHRVHDVAGVGQALRLAAAMAA
ncbi:dihydropteroate synthase [Solidesulfovibrio fructosivorans JJ]]|uniref:Dihydropteroate synthase n=1 Tax=Solidesulfovibrio fructosivorans JJ] TaxID=596151 RepID=E1JZ31_SOLFR|nr:dihydropteroate synthase [Solidesulfovibrio fructosivorans]EFL50447.1 dihydropteroate synthase [Solidesulfovibrio fructosivorans JJ]]